MKKYILFSWQTYYPSGGINDLCDDFDTFEEAFSRLKKCINECGDDCYQIVESKTLKVVAQGEKLYKIE